MSRIAFSASIAVCSGRLRSSCHLMSRICVLSHVRSLLRDRLIGWRNGNRVAMLKSTGETESGSAGTQPDKGYPARWCAKGAVGPWRVRLSGAFCFPPFGHRRHASENPSSESPSRLGRQKKIRLLFVLEAPGCVRKVGHGWQRRRLMSNGGHALLRHRAKSRSASVRVDPVILFLRRYDRAVIGDDGFVKQFTPPEPRCNRFPVASPSARG